MRISCDYSMGKVAGFQIGREEEFFEKREII